jgi:phage tail-like protein
VALDPKDPKNLAPRKNQLSRLLEYLPAIFREQPPDVSPPLPLGRFLMAFESILLGLPKSSDDECRDLLYQPGFEEILGGALRQGTKTKLLDGIQRYFDPVGSADLPDSEKVANYNRAPAEFLSWLAGWVALTLRDDWTDDKKRLFIAKAVRLYRLRGTKAGVKEFVEAYTDGPVEILDDAKPFSFKVKLKTSGTHIQKDMDIVNAIVELQKPAHTSFGLEVETVQFQIGKTATIGSDTLLGVRGG